MSQEAPPKRINRTGLTVCVGLLMFSLFLIANPLPFHNPIAEPTPVPAWVADTTPVRQPALEPEYQVGVYSFRCGDCHKLFPPPARHSVRTVTQHREIVLKHGINTWCLSCHHPKNRNAFVDDRGREIPWDEPQLLCSRCHGPVYRDWQHGAHGRTNGYWDKARGNQTRRKCIECHDPHQPPFPPMHPAPGPNTLRMGPQGRETHADVHNPLKVRGHAGGANRQDVRIEEER